MTTTGTVGGQGDTWHLQVSTFVPLSQAVIWVVTQALRDEPNIGCGGGYTLSDARNN